LAQKAEECNKILAGVNAKKVETSFMVWMIVVSNVLTLLITLFLSYCIFNSKGKATQAYAEDIKDDTVNDNTIPRVSQPAVDNK
jgi:hypothetical protein